MTAGHPRKRRAGRHSSAWIRPDKRWAIYVRDGLRCVWCGDDAACLDHLFARASRWRDNDPRRIVSACTRCNTMRKATPPAGWLRFLRDRGQDVAAIYRRLQVVRYVPINRLAGRRARCMANPLPPIDPAAAEFIAVDLFGVPT